MRSQIAALTVTTLLGALALALPAAGQATVRMGTGVDPAGDALSMRAEEDVRNATGSADDATGRVAATVELGAAPTAGAFILAAVGTRQSDQTCGAPAALLRAFPDQRRAEYSADGGESWSPGATLRVSGAAISVEATDAAFPKPFDCLDAGVARDNTLQDETDEPVPLSAPEPPPPTATQPPPPAPSAPAPKPAPAPIPAPVTTATSPPVPVPKRAELTVSLGGTPRRIRRDKAFVLRLRVTNDGLTTSSRVKLSRTSARGLRLRGMPRTIKALKPGQRRSYRLRVRLTRKARISSQLTVTARAKGTRGSSSVQLRVGKRKSLPSKGGTGGSTTPAGGGESGAPTPKNPLIGTYWWRTVVHSDYAWDNRALIFVDGSTVYSGFPKGGIPASCTTLPAKPENEFDERDGCLSYSYDAATGAVTIGDKTGTFKDGKLVMDGEDYLTTQVPAAGTRLSFVDHRHTSFSGVCGIYYTCTVGKRFFSLSPDGQFALSGSSTTTGGTPGQNSFAVGSASPDQYGTYEIRAGGTIHLAFADGSVRDELITVLVNDKTGQPDPAGEGVLLGDDNFYPDPTP